MWMKTQRQALISIPLARGPWDGRPMCPARWIALGCGAIASLTALGALAAEAGRSAPAAAPSAAGPALTSASASAPPTYALSWVRAEGAEECPNGHALA